MNRRAKRNKYKNNLRHLQNKLREYEKAFERQEKFQKKVEVETLTCAIPINRELEFSYAPKEKIKQEQERMVLDHFDPTS